MTMKSPLEHPHELITISNCSINNQETTILSHLSLIIKPGHNWLITGSNGSGKSALGAALCQSKDLSIIPHDGGLYSNTLSSFISRVSFELAASLIEDEHKRDDSDFIEGGIDSGRTPRNLLDNPSNQNPYVMLTGIEAFLDTGLKFLSTGEIRRVLLCQALLTQSKLLVLDEPFEGLDAQTKANLILFLEGGMENLKPPQFLLIMDRIEHVPQNISQVLELTERSVSFSGTLSDYRIMTQHKRDRSTISTQTLEQNLCLVQHQTELSLKESIHSSYPLLVEMNNVTVEWSEKKILDGMYWKLIKGEHWLIRGPNGSGKTTFLELITGDNPQVYRNDVRLFGRKRGSGETIWEIKEKMGIVSYRLHLDWRNLGDTRLVDVVLSGLHDSIGLYQSCGEVEQSLAHSWITLAGFQGREHERFSNLSYGEQRAILIARAAVKSPPLLILDEPCHGLDHSYRSRILSLLEVIAQKGYSTLLHVTHDPSEVLPSEKHILELCPGETPMWKIIEQGN